MHADDKFEPHWSVAKGILIVTPPRWKCYKTIVSRVSCAFIEIWRTWEFLWELKKLELPLRFRLEQLLRVLLVLQTCLAISTRNACLTRKLVVNYPYWLKKVCMSIFYRTRLYQFAREKWLKYILAKSSLIITTYLCKNQLWVTGLLWQYLEWMKCSMLDWGLGSQTSEWETTVEYPQFILSEQCSYFGF